MRRKENIISPVQPLPNQIRLLAKMEYYAFIHFNMNTFTNKVGLWNEKNPI